MCLVGRYAPSVDDEALKDEVRKDFKSGDEASRVVAQAWEDAWEVPKTQINTTHICVSDANHASPLYTPYAKHTSHVAPLQHYTCSCEWYKAYLPTIHSLMLSIPPHGAALHHYTYLCEWCKACLSTVHSLMLRTPPMLHPLNTTHVGVRNTKQASPLYSP